MNTPAYGSSWPRPDTVSSWNPNEAIRTANPQRILLVDDNEELRGCIEKALKAAGHQVLTAADGKKALVIAANETMDVVLLDVLMPEKDGLETLRELRREYPEIPVVVMSGGGQFGCELFIGAARMLGASMILLKPFMTHEVIAAIDICVLRKQTRS